MIRIPPVLLLAATLLLPATALASPPGTVVKRSAHPVGATLDRLAAAVQAKGFTVVARVDHAAAARKAGKTLRPTQVLIFGNPKVGTALMSSRQSIGLHLPVRVVAWEDAGGAVWVAYDDPGALAARHGIADRAAVVKKMSGALAAFTDRAAAAD